MAVNRRVKKGGGARTASPCRDGEIQKEGKRIWYADQAHSYPDGRLTVGGTFPRFLWLLSSELSCRGSDEEARRQLGVSSGQLSQYRDASPEKQMAHVTLQAVCLTCQMWAHELEFGDASWAEGVDASLKAMGFKPKSAGSVRKRIGHEKWLELRRQAEGQQDESDTGMLVGNIRKMIVRHELTHEGFIDRLALADELDEKPSRVRSALDKLVKERTLLPPAEDDANLYRVATMSREAVEELLRVRSLIEEMLIVELADDEDRRNKVLALMRSRHTQLLNAKKLDDAVGFVSNDIEFHAALALGRIYIEDIHRQTLQVVSTVTLPADVKKADYKRVCDEHSKIMKLIRVGTDEAVREAATLNKGHMQFAYL